MTITKLEDSENHRNAFEISGDRHRLWVLSVRAPRQRPSCAGPTEPPGAAWACCWASLGCACTRSAPLPPLQPVSLSSREHDRADLGVLQQPAGPPRVGGPPAEADEGRLGGEPQQQASLGAVTHRKGPARRPRARRARPGLGPLCRRVLIPRGLWLPHRDPLVSQACPSASREFTHVHAHGSLVRRPVAPG